MAGIDVEAMDADAHAQAEIKDEAEEEARGAILFQAIAEREGITVSDADLQKRIAELAAVAQENAEEAARRAGAEQRHPRLEAQIREQKTLDMLISQAKITDGDPDAS